MGSFDFKDLEYIVMEGGGARGSAYLGAIKALEKRMAELHVATQSNPDESKIFVRELESFDENGNKRKPGLLDYYKKVEDPKTGVIIEKPVIKGIAGSSAGAITTFALALGFNSDEIEIILKYDFKNFLSEKDAGKYRMITSEGELAVGEDLTNPKTGNKVLSFSEKFEYTLKDNKTKIKGDKEKLIKRNLVFTAIINTIGTGISANVTQLTNLEKYLDKWFPEDNPKIEKNWAKALYKIFVRPTNGLVKKLAYTKLFNFIFFKVIVKVFLKSPIDVDADSLSNVVLDRGMFSGFATREFFLDMMLLALTKDTAFHRGYVDFTFTYTEQNIKNKDDIKNEFLSIKDFSIGNRKGKFNNNIFIPLIFDLTFKDFYQISPCHFAVCVSNYTTDAPVYFSYQWTPDFRLAEAVAGSMSIPPAIKPIYNESNVLKFFKTSFSENAEVYTPKGFEDEFKFSLREYYLYELAVKRAIAQKLFEKGVNIDVNNNINISTFLEPLKELLIGSFDQKEPTLEKLEFNTGIKLNEPVGKIDYVDFYVLVYFYNVAYKGLLLDGGYRNNIPYNFFRDKETGLKGILAIKLDGSFPPEILDSARKQIEKYVELLNQIKLLEEAPEILTDPVFRVLFPKILRVYKEIRYILNGVYEDYFLHLEKKYIDLENKAKNTKEKSEIRNIRKELKNIKNQVKREDKHAIKDLRRSVIKSYRKIYLTEPWKTPKSILITGLEGYAFGSEQGQVRNISDHNHIIPIFDFGVGTYDFDMTKVQPQIYLAQTLSETTVYNFFK